MLAAYARFAGAPADVALIARATRGPDGEDARAWLGEITCRAEETIDAKGVDLAASDRGLARHTRWQDVAARAHAATPACQAAAPTLARIATETAPSAERAATARAHDDIWQALRGAETGGTAMLPSLRHAAARVGEHVAEERALLARVLDRDVRMG